MTQNVLGISNPVVQTIGGVEYTYMGTIDTRRVPRAEHDKWHDKFHPIVYFRGYAVTLVDTPNAKHEEFDVWLNVPKDLTVAKSKLYTRWLEFTAHFRTFKHGNT